jgi:hypothetical protein
MYCFDRFFFVTSISNISGTRPCPIFDQDVLKRQNLVFLISVIKVKPGLRHLFEVGRLRINYAIVRNSISLGSYLEE